MLGGKYEQVIFKDSNAANIILNFRCENRLLKNTLISRDINASITK